MRTFFSAALLGIILSLEPAAAQEPLDLFEDEPELSEEFIRIATWNLRHIDVQGGAADFLAGTTEEEDFAILTATFAKAIDDLDLDLVAVVEHRPRHDEPNRLRQIRDHLDAFGGEWMAHESEIEYENPNHPFSGLQFGLLWKTDRISIDTDEDVLLTELRQPRDDSGDLLHRRLRAPWLVPVQAGNLEFDLVVLHLKSGGEAPQAAEVEALRQFILGRQTVTTPRHLIVCGDWNIRPDRSTGRARLRSLMVPTAGGNLMRVLTAEDVPPSLEGWAELGSIDAGDAVSTIVPFTHYNASSVDTFLDHIAISSTLVEEFDHPVRVERADGRSDVSRGIRVAVPHVREEDYRLLTDHLPVVLTLRTTGTAPEPPPAPSSATIVAAVPNPTGNDEQLEEVHVRNNTDDVIDLDGWRIGDATGSRFWVLDGEDGDVLPGQVRIVVRRGRPMALNNSGGDTIVLFNEGGEAVDTKSYQDGADSGRIFRFDQHAGASPRPASSRRPEGTKTASIKGWGRPFPEVPQGFSGD